MCVEGAIRIQKMDPLKLELQAAVSYPNVGAWN